MWQSRVQLRVVVDRGYRLLLVVGGIEDRHENQRLFGCFWLHLFGIAAVTTHQMQNHSGFAILFVLFLFDGALRHEQIIGTNWAESHGVYMV